MALIIVGVGPLVAWPVYTVALFVVVPCLNEERVVATTVASAPALSGPWGTRTRVLVVDDGPDDATPDVPKIVASRRISNAPLGEMLRYLLAPG